MSHSENNRIYETVWEEIEEESKQGLLQKEIERTAKETNLNPEYDIELILYIIAEHRIENLGD